MSYKEYRISNGYFYKEWRNELGLFHREDGPAQIWYNPDGSIHWEEFYINGDLHRESGPAYIQYNPDGSIEIEYFYIHGELLGDDEEGFWALWDRLTEVGRQTSNLLTYLARYS